MSLDDYIKHFKQDYQKYFEKDTNSVSSIDTEELLSDFSSETSSNQSRPISKSSIKSLSALKQRSKKPKVSKPSHLKPLHSTPLKMIQEEEEFYDSQNKLSEFMPNNKFDIKDYLPKARAEKNKKVDEILASLDLESENMSIVSSVDTEFLLQSSDEEDSAVYDKILKKKSQENFRPTNTNEIPKFASEKILKIPEKKNFKDGGSKSHNLSVAKSQVLSIFPKKLSMETLSLSVSSSRKSEKNEKGKDLKSPSLFFNSVLQSSQQNKKNLKVCTCILSGSLFTHFSNCSPAIITAEIGKIQTLPKRKRLSVVEGIVLIQRIFRKFSARKKIKAFSEASKKNFVFGKSTGKYLENGKNYAEKGKNYAENAKNYAENVKNYDVTKKNFAEIPKKYEGLSENKPIFSESLNFSIEKLKGPADDYYKKGNLSENSLESQKRITEKRKVNEINIDEASKTLNDAFKELEALKNLASDRSSEVSKDYSQEIPQLNLNFSPSFQNFSKIPENFVKSDYEPSDVNTEDLLNSSFSSILSRN